MGDKISLLELGYIVHIGNKVLEDLGPVEPLKGIHLEIYHRYTSMIDKNIVELKEKWNDDQNLQSQGIEELNNEKLHIECFCRWLQEESKTTLLKEEKEE